MKLTHLLAIFTAFVGIASVASGQGILLPDKIDEPKPVPLPRPVPIPRPRPIYVQPFYVKNLKVNTVINDAVAETTVEQTFVNTSSVQQEGTYLYPLPEGSIPSAFSMTVGDKTLEPKVLSKDEARNIYQGYVRRYQDPALLEYVGRNLVKISVFPIPPQGERVIRMRYTEVLKPQNDVRKYSYALSTSRFANRPIGVTSVSIKLNTTSAIKNVFSPSHDVSVRKSNDHTAMASWEGTNEVSDRDLTLFYSTNNDDVGLSLLSYKSGDRDGYFMLLASPRVNIAKNKVLPKQVVFVLDKTGSMNGEKIVQARKSLLFCLNSLNANDQFNVITFNESQDILFPTTVLANVANVEKARKFTEKIEALGGTNIDDALKAGLSQFEETKEAHNRMMVFITDGLPTIGETDGKTIAQHFEDKNGKQGTLGKHVRLFSFGVGFDVNVPLLDKISDVGRGEAEYVKPNEDIEAKVASFYSKVASPVLGNIKFEFDGADVYDVYPKALPDLFKGSQLVVSGRFRSKEDATVKLMGLTSGDKQTFTLKTNFGTGDGSNNFLPRIWATRKLGFLIDQVRLTNNPAGQKEVIDEIVRLSKEYGIITEYTSFLVDENERVALGINGDIASPDNLLRLRDEVQRRASVFGEKGEAVVGQSGRAKDLKQNAQNYSRYQSANGSVEYYAKEDRLSATKKSRGNFGGVPGGPGGSTGFGTQGLGGGGRGGDAGGQPRRGRLPNSLSTALPDKALEDAQRDSITLQAIGDRTFYRQANNVWQDHSYNAKKQKNLVKIQVYSDAHFALLKAFPSLNAYSSVGDEVIIRTGDNNAVQIGQSGKDKITTKEIAELKK